MTEEQDRDRVQEDECVVRYVRPKQVHEDGGVALQAFVLSPRDEKDGLSLNRPAKFSGSPEERLKEIVTRIRMKVTKQGRFACFSVRELGSMLRGKKLDPEFRPDPIPAEDGEPCDPSHALLCGLPLPSLSEEQKEAANDVGELMARAASVKEPPI